MKGKSFLISLLMLVSLSFGVASKVFAEPQDIYSQQSIKERIVREAINRGLDPAFALSVAKQESGFNSNARSPVGAIGLFQLMPQTARDLGYNPNYIDQNIKGGIYYLKSLKDQFGSNELALAAYNAGPGAVSRYGGIPPYRETQHYVSNIMSFYRNYQVNPDIALINRPDKVAKKVNTEKIASSKAVDETPVKETKEVKKDNQNFALNNREFHKEIAMNFLAKIWSFLT